MDFKLILCLGCCVAGICLSGCDDPLSGNSYERVEAKQVSRVAHGSIVAKRTVKIQRHAGVGTGAVAGGAAGAGLGMLVGNAVSSGGKGQAVGAGLGALAGGIAGNAIQNRNVEGYEYEIELDNNGGNLIVTQGKTPELSVGQRVKVISNNTSSRVVPE